MTHNGPIIGGLKLFDVDDEQIEEWSAKGNRAKRSRFTHKLHVRYVVRELIPFDL